MLAFPLAYIRLALSASDASTPILHECLHMPAGRVSREDNETSCLLASAQGHSDDGGSIAGSSGREALSRALRQLPQLKDCARVVPPTVHIPVTTVAPVLLRSTGPKESLTECARVVQELNRALKPARIEGYRTAAKLNPKP